MTAYKQVADIINAGRDDFDDDDMPTDRIKVSGADLDGPCPVDGKRHSVMIGMTGDMLPFFCTKGCKMWSGERPPSITDEDMENL